MAISPRTKQILWGKAGAMCAFPNCKKLLVRDSTDNDREVLIGEIAHIVAQNEEGPRRDNEVPGGEIDGYDNLILVCHEHHEIVDQQVNTYPVERLVQFKTDHEDWVRNQLTRSQEFEGLYLAEKTVTETVFSTLLPVTSIPHFIYSGGCKLTESEVKALLKSLDDPKIFVPFIIRSGNLFSFNDLTDLNSPFSKVIDPLSAKQEHIKSWLNKPEYTRWYVEILNRTLNKITGRLGLKLDKEHNRYYFEPDESGKEKRVEYKSVSGNRSTRNVAWNPHFKHNNESKNYWEHLAVGLRFHRIGELSWGLAIRPERRFTSDGFTSLEGKSVGRKSTKRKSRMYNFDVLKEVQFWRDFLSQGKPRVICNFGGQALNIDNVLLNASITWPEIEGDQADRLKATYEEDLFTLNDLIEVNQFDDFDDDIDELDMIEGDEIED